MSDFQKSFSAIVPSTYRGVDGIVECTPIKWQDVAGYDHVKEALKQVQLKKDFPVLLYLHNVLCTKCFSKQKYILFGRTMRK